VFDWWILIAIAYGLYLVECVAWIDRGSWACFTMPIRGRWRCIRGSELPGNDRGGFLVVNPLSASPAVVVSCLWPISVSPEGVCSASPGDQTPSGPPVYVSFTEMRTVRADVNGVYVNGRLLARGSLALSLALARLIEKCRKAKLNLRETYISDALAAAADVEKARTTWAECCKQTRMVQWSATILLWYTLVLAPAVILSIGPYPTWPWLLAGLVIGTLVTAIQYCRAHGKLYPESRFERWVQTTAMILLPLGAMRAAVNLSRNALDHYGPFAVLPGVCGAGVAARHFRVALWDLQRLPVFGDERPSAEVVACMEWCRAATAAAAIEAMSASKVDIHGAPDRDDAGSVSYCPRCHAQFQREGVTCHVCGDVPVVPFDAAPTSTPAL
jgi:hypothetical protein